VIPKTQQVRGFVNDKRTIKQPEDIKSPLGVKNREEQFERPNTRIERDAKVSKNPYKSKDPMKVQSPKVASKSKDEWKHEKKTNRDWQFKRNEESSKKHYSPYLNPYYKDRDRSPDRDDDSRIGTIPWLRSPEADNDYEVSPRYLDEARKYFEKFDQRKSDSAVRRSESPSSPSDRSAPRSYGPYGPPRKDYKAPEIRRPEIRRDNSPGRSNNNNNNNRRSNNSSNHSNKEKH
jgi:hypothetical protein